MSGLMNPVYYNPLQTNAFKHVYGVLVQIQSNSSGVVKKKTKLEEFFKAAVHGFGKKGKIHGDLVERYKRGSLSFMDFMDSICGIQDLRMREVGKAYTLCWDYYYNYIEPRLLDVNELPIIRKTHLFIYWLVFCAVDIDCSCELTADKICDLLSFLCENSFQEVGPSVYTSLRRTNYSYDFVTFIQIIFANCLKTLNDNMKGELARKLYDRFVKGVILSGFLMRQQVVGPIKSYIKRLCKLNPNKLEVYEIGKNNEQRMKAEIVLNQHSQIAMIIKDFDPMKFYFQVTCGHTQNITKFFAEDEITRFKWITEMKRVIKYHMEGNVTYQVNIGSDQPSNPGNILYQVPDPQALPVLRGNELNFDTVIDNDETGSMFGGASVLTVNTSVSQQIRGSVIDAMIEESLYNQVPSNIPVPGSDVDTVLSDGSDGSGNDPKKSTGVDEAQLIEEQFYQNVDPNLPPPPIPDKKKPAKIEDKRPVAAPRRKTERAPATTEITPATTERAPATTEITPAPADVIIAPENATNPMPQPIPRRKTTLEPSAVDTENVDPSKESPKKTQKKTTADASKEPSANTKKEQPKEPPANTKIEQPKEPPANTKIEQPKEPPATAPKPAVEPAMANFDPPAPISIPTESDTKTTDTDASLPPPKPAHTTAKAVKSDNSNSTNTEVKQIDNEKPTGQV